LEEKMSALPSRSLAGRKWAFLLSPLALGPVLLCYPAVSMLMALGFRVFPVAYARYSVAGIVTVLGVLALLRLFGYTAADLGWKGFKPRHIALGLGGAAAAYLLWWGTMALAAALGLPSWSATYKFTQPAWQLPLIVLMNGLIGPFLEETLFRGYLLTAWRERFGTIAAWIASFVLFALLHYIPFGAGAVILIVPWTIVPTLLAWKTKSLWPAYVMHAANNVVAYAIIPLLR
jgi:membrane protease YdiL (CAAX protease family)